jgi:CheY-like chemotaxis protein
LAPGEELSMPTATLRVLVADASQPVRESVMTRLEALGLVAVAVADGLSAWSLLRGEPFELLLADVDTPHLGGLDLLDQVSLLRPHLPVLLMSSDPGNCLAALHRGARGFLVKPFGSAALEATLEQVLPFWRPPLAGRGETGCGQPVRLLGQLAGGAPRSVSLPTRGDPVTSCVSPRTQALADAFCYLEHLVTEAKGLLPKRAHDALRTPTDALRRLLAASRRADQVGSRSKALRSVFADSWHLNEVRNLREQWGAAPPRELPEELGRTVDAVLGALQTRLASPDRQAPDLPQTQKEGAGRRRCVEQSSS